MFPRHLVWQSVPWGHTHRYPVSCSIHLNPGLHGLFTHSDALVSLHSESAKYNNAFFNFYWLLITISKEPTTKKGPQISQVAMKQGLMRCTWHSFRTNTLGDLLTPVGQNYLAGSAQASPLIHNCDPISAFFSNWARTFVARKHPNRGHDNIR